MQQEYIFRRQRYSSKICERLCKKYEAKVKRSSIKNGWSPEYMVHKAHLNAMIEIRRHITGAKRRWRWRSSEEANTNIGLIMDYWKAQVAELHLKLDVTHQLFNITERGIDWWRTLQRLPTE